MTERAHILKIDRETTAAKKTPSGYAAVPREMTRRKDLSGQAHKVLTAILGLCYGDERHTRASVRQISAACGMRRRSVEFYLAELTRLKLIDRRHKDDRPGGVKTTFILCHPKEFVLSNEPNINWRVTEPPTCVPTPRRILRDPPQNPARPPAESCATRLTDSQQILDLGGEATDRYTDSRTATPDPASSSPPPPPIWTSDQQEVVDLATARWGACNGDYFVGDLLRVYDAELVMEAIDRHFYKVGPNLKPSLLAATCRGMFQDGWKPNRQES